MKTIRKYRQAFLLGTIFCMLFFALRFPCGAQEAGETLSEYQAADVSAENLNQLTGLDGTKVSSTVCPVRLLK